MKPTALIPAIVLAVAAASLSACDEGYGYGVSSGWGPEPYAYDGWYDGYYGPVYDGYWGDDGMFWYRSGAGDRHFRRGDANHFRRDMPGSSVNTGRSFQHFQGSIPSQPSARMPHFPHRGH